VASSVAGTTTAEDDEARESDGGVRRDEARGAWSERVNGEGGGEARAREAALLPAMTATWTGIA
jgi:hypothetical protein